jgi:tetratricopeptide (TPR) repeat protein
MNHRAALLLALLILTTKTISAETAKECYEEGLLYLSKHQYSDAIASFLSAISKNPYYKEAYNRLGEVYYLKGSFKEAIFYFKEATNLDEYYIDAHNNLGRAYERDGQLDSAYSQYQKVLEIDPLNVDAHYNLAGIFYKKRQIRDAIGEYKRVIELDPGYFLAYINLGTIYWKEEASYPKAISYYEEAKAQDPTSSIPHLNLGSLYFEQKELDKAVSEYKNALKKDPKSLYALNMLGKIYIEKREYESAEKIYRRLIDLLPKDSTAHYTLGTVAEAQKKFGEAAEWYEKALLLDPHNEVALFRLDRIILELKRESVYSKRRRNSASVHLYLGDHYFKERIIPLSLYEYRRSISLNPQSASARYSLSRVYEHQGLFSYAINELMRVREIDPTNVTASDLLEKVYWKAKRTFCFREEIDLSKLPPPIIKLLVVRFCEKDVIHQGVSEFINHLLLSLLSYFPQVRVLSPERIEMEKERLKIEEIKRKRDAIMLAEELLCDLLLWATVEENEEEIKIEASLINLENLQEVLNVTSIGIGNNKIKEAVAYLQEKVIEAIPVRGNIFKIDGDTVWINLGSRHGIKEKDTLEIIEKKEMKIDPLTGRLVGYKEKSIGKVQISAVEALIAKAVVTTPYTTDILRLNQEVRLLREE